MGGISPAHAYGYRHILRAGAIFLGCVARRARGSEGSHTPYECHCEWRTQEEGRRAQRMVKIGNAVSFRRTSAPCRAAASSHGGAASRSDAIEGTVRGKENNQRRFGSGGYSVCLPTLRKTAWRCAGSRRGIRRRAKASGRNADTGLNARTVSITRRTTRYTRCCILGNLAPAARGRSAAACLPACLTSIRYRGATLGANGGRHSKAGERWHSTKAWHAARRHAW